MPDAYRWWTVFWFDDGDGKGLKCGPVTICKTYIQRVGYWYVSVLGHPLYDGWRRSIHV